MIPFWIQLGRFPDNKQANSLSMSRSCDHPHREKKKLTCLIIVRCDQEQTSSEAITYL